MVSIGKKNHLIINNYNALEADISKFLLKYFSPQKNEAIFENVLLSSAIVGMGHKIKILNNIDDFDPKIISDLRNLNSIRNGIAHNITSGGISIPDYSVSYQFKMLNSQGKLVTKDFEKEFENFQGLYSKISKYVKSFSESLD